MPRNLPVDPPAPTLPDTVWVAWEHEESGPRIVAIAPDELTARRSAMELIANSPHVTEVPLDGSEVFAHLVPSIYDGTAKLVEKVPEGSEFPDPKTGAYAYTLTGAEGAEVMPRSKRQESYDASREDGLAALGLDVQPEPDPEA